MTAGPGGIRGSAPHQLNELVARTKPRVWPIPVALFRHHCIITLAIPLAAAAGSSSSGNHFLISFAPAQHGPGDARGRVGHREQHDVGRPAGEQAGEPGRADLLLASRPAEMGARTMHQQASDVAVSALGNMPEPLLAAARVLLRYQTQPGGDLARRAELNGIATLATTAVAVIRPTPGISASRRLASQEECQARSFFSIRAICSWIARI